MMSANSQETDLVLNSYLLFKVSRYLKVGQKYKKKFFRLCQASSRGGPRLEYDDNKVINLEQVLAVQPRVARSEPKKFAFQVLCNPQVHHFACETEEDRKRWIDAIRNLVFAGGRAYPGEGTVLVKAADTFEVEIDHTNSSRQLKLYGIYLLEVTNCNIILWLPRSKQEMIRWSLVNIHNIDCHRPRGAVTDRLIIELNQFSATGPGTLMFKVENGRRLVEVLEERTGQRFDGFRKPFRGKSLHRHTTSQEDLSNLSKGTSVTLQPFTDDSLLAGNSFEESKKRAFSSGNLSKIGYYNEGPFVERGNVAAPPVPLTWRSHHNRCASEDVPLPPLPARPHATRQHSTLPTKSPSITVTAPLLQQENGRLTPIDTDQELSDDSGHDSPDSGRRPVSPFYPQRVPPTPPGPHLQGRWSSDSLPPMPPGPFLQGRRAPDTLDGRSIVPVTPSSYPGPEPPPRPQKFPQLEVNKPPFAPRLGDDEPPIVPPRPPSTLSPAPSPPLSPSSSTDESGRPPHPLPRPVGTLSSPSSGSPIRLRQKYENVEQPVRLSPATRHGSASTEDARGGHWKM